MSEENKCANSSLPHRYISFVVPFVLIFNINIDLTTFLEIAVYPKQFVEKLCSAQGLRSSIYYFHITFEGR